MPEEADEDVWEVRELSDFWQLASLYTSDATSEGYVCVLAYALVHAPYIHALMPLHMLAARCASVRSHVGVCWLPSHV